LRQIYTPNAGDVSLWAKHRALLIRVSPWARLSVVFVVEGYVRLMTTPGLGRLIVALAIILTPYFSGGIGPSRATRKIGN